MIKLIVSEFKGKKTVKEDKSQKSKYSLIIFIGILLYSRLKYIKVNPVLDQMSCKKNIYKGNEADNFYLRSSGQQITNVNHVIFYNKKKSGPHKRKRSPILY